MGTPLLLAKKYCANWDDGICKGINFRKDGSMFRFRDEGCPCLLKTGSACSYFESAVLPMRSRHPNDWLKVEEGEDFREGAAEYYRHHVPHLASPLPLTRERKCPDCGTPVPTRMRYCDNCKKRHRRETFRASQQKTRVRVNS